MRLDRLPTPALVLDLGRLRANCARMTAAVTGRGVRLRPHLKTAKSIDVARAALEGNFGGITVSTLNEAEYFAGHGITDILYAVGITPDKLDRVAALQRLGVRVRLVVDDPGVAAAVAERGAQMETVFHVMVEVDPGEARGGVPWESDALIAIGRALDEGDGTELAGIMAHAGHSYAARDLASVAAVAEDERRQAVGAAQRLRAAGLPCPEVSVGSTPTALHAESADGLTEVRAGVYMFGDLFQAQIGSCAVDDLAVGVLATVIGHRRDKGTILIDAGALALSKDRSTAGMPLDAGFGLVAPAAGGAPIPGLTVDRVFQEHGLIRSCDGAPPFDALPIGSRVRVLPNHVCMTAAMYDRYHVVDEAGPDPLAIADVWDRTNGWGPVAV